MDGFIKGKKFTWKSVLFLVALVVGFMILQSKMEKPLLDKKLMEAANEINKTTPIMVDSITRFDNAVALTENKFQYNYTLISADKASTDTTNLKNQIEESIINFVKTDPKSQLFRDNKTTLLFNYRDKSGSYLFNIIVSADKYEN